MKNFVIILVIMSSISLGCKKKLCSMVRYDIGYAYDISNQDTTYTIGIWKDPYPLDTSLAKEITDSFEKLEQMGYTVKIAYAMRYSYADCDFCEQLNRKKPSAKATCYETE